MGRKYEVCPKCGKKGVYLTTFNASSRKAKDCRYCKRRVWAEMNKLKPCPFCGGEAEFWGDSLSVHNPEEWATFCIQCKSCQGGTAVDYANAKEAIQAWDRRFKYDTTNKRHR